MGASNSDPPDELRSRLPERRRSGGMCGSAGCGEAAAPPAGEAAPPAVPMAQAEMAMVLSASTCTTCENQVRGMDTEDAA